MSDYLPPELLTEILLKLPVKSLIRFTIVCKLWQTLITSPSFISAHFSNPTKHHPLLLRRYDKTHKLEHYSLLKLSEKGPFCVSSSSQFEFPFKTQIGYFRVVGSCHGVVCLSDDYFANPSQPIILWNPSVRKFVTLPDAVINPKGPHIFVLGFGVSGGDDYKVVRLVYRRRPDDFGFNVPPQVEVFSIRTGRWREKKGVDVGLRVLEFMWSQVFLNGFVHWCAYELVNVHSCRSSILTFEVGREAFGEVALPGELAREAVTNLCVHVIGGSLGVVRYDREVGSGLCDVWVMKEYGVVESWTRLYRIDLGEGMEKVVSFWNGGEVLVASKGFELLAYNPETKQTKDLGLYGTARSFYVDNYAESLVLFKRHTQVVEEESSRDAFEELTENALEELNLDGCHIGWMETEASG